MKEAHALRLRETGPAILSTLLDLGFDLQEVVDLPGDMAAAYDVARKPKGHQIGAFGPAGVRIYQYLAKVDHLDPDWTIFRAGRIVSAEQLADETAFSVNTIKKALVALIEHGFVERVKEGRSSRLLPLLPKVAIVEAVQRELGFSFGDDDPPHIATRRRRWAAALSHLQD